MEQLTAQFKRMMTIGQAIEVVRLLRDYHARSDHETAAYKGACELLWMANVTEARVADLDSGYTQAPPGWRLHPDGNGMTRVMTDETQEIVWKIPDNPTAQT